MEHGSFSVSWNNATLDVPCNSVSPQDMRLWTADTRDDSVVCNNEKLVSGGTTEYLHEAAVFLRQFLFADGTHWPDAILASSMLVTREDSPNNAVQVMVYSGLLRFETS